MQNSGTDSVMVSISITWNTVRDDRVCPVCRALEGYTWFFEAGNNELGNSLIHPVYGVVWDTVNGSQAHGHRGHCRCSITPDFNVDSLLVRCQGIRDALLQIIPEPLGEK